MKESQRNIDSNQCLSKNQNLLKKLIILYSKWLQNQNKKVDLTFIVKSLNLFPVEIHNIEIANNNLVIMKKIKMLSKKKFRRQNFRKGKETRPKR